MAANRDLAAAPRSLPPMLHIRRPRSALSYSKGSRGLFVPLRVGGIFTATTISPSSWLRQCPDRYTIRAGRNLPDKEFRYLRTVIVTAAVYRGFDSMLLSRLHPLLTFRHRAGVRPYMSSCDLAKPCVFVKQSPGPFLCAHLAMGPLIPKLRGKFAEFLSHDSLEHLRILSSPTCVGLRYGLYMKLFGDFLGSPLTASITSPEGSVYCQTSAQPAFNFVVYLRPLTNYSVSWRACHIFVPPKYHIQVMEY